jgi:Uma2 family endonuclease
MANHIDAPEMTRVSDLLRHLGGISSRRICLKPTPGTAKVRDLIRAERRTGRLFELVDGTLVEKPMGQVEAYLTAELMGQLWLFLQTHALGYLTGADGGMRVVPGLVRLPDISFIAWDQLPSREVSPETYPHLSPALAVEVLSRSNTRREMQRKRKEYFLGGTRLVWIIDPRKRTVEVWTSPDDCVTLIETDTLDGGDVLPGFRLPLRELFAKLPKAPAPKRSSGRRKK